jgi:hypothetical protein
MFYAFILLGAYTLETEAKYSFENTCWLLTDYTMLCPRWEHVWWSAQGGETSLCSVLHEYIQGNISPEEKNPCSFRMVALVLLTLPDSSVFIADILSTVTLTSAVAVNPVLWNDYWQAVPGCPPCPPHSNSVVAQKANQLRIPKSKQLTKWWYRIIDVYVVTMKNVVFWDVVCFSC